MYIYIIYIYIIEHYIILLNRLGLISDLFCLEFCVCVLFSWTKFSLCSLDWPQTCGDSPVSSSLVLRFQACTPIPWLIPVFYIAQHIFNYYEKDPGKQQQWHHNFSISPKPKNTYTQNSDKRTEGFNRLQHWVSSCLR